MDVRGRMALMAVNIDDHVLGGRYIYAAIVGEMSARDADARACVRL